jgi:hypothetical protein
MKKTSPETIEALRAYATAHPEDGYPLIAASFGVSVITMKRHCSDLGRGKGWRRGRKEATPNADRFWQSVDRTGEGCWLWKGCLNNSGYGFMHFDGSSKAAHRIAYLLEHGSVPEGFELDHRCRNRACCKPDHLEAITHAENMKRVRLAQGRGGSPAGDGSPDLLDPFSDVGTGRDLNRETRNDFAPSIVNGRKLNGGGGSRREVYVSTRHPNARDPLDVGMERVLQRESEDELWGLSSKQLGAMTSWANKLRFFWVKFPGGLRIDLLARSAKDAKAMVVSIWGSRFNIEVEEASLITDTERAARQRATWRTNLREHYDKWITTDEAKRIMREQDEKQLAHEGEQRLDREAKARFEFEDEYRARQQRKSAKKDRRQRCLKCKRLEKERYKTYDDPGDGDDDDY